MEANLQAIYFLPCKVVVFDSDGQTTIGMMLPSVMLEALQDSDLNAFAHEVEGQSIDLAMTMEFPDEA